MTKPNQTKPLIIILLILLITGCKKERVLKTGSLNSSQLVFNDKMEASNSLVTFNTTYGVLVFESFEKLNELQDYLIDYSNNFPYNRNNTEKIFTILKDIKANGFVDKTAEKNFKKLLLSSHPLSNSVLEEIITVNNSMEGSFPIPLFETIFCQNASFSSHILDLLEDANIPAQSLENIINCDDNDIMVPDFTYEDFLLEFQGFNSLYKKLETIEENQLLSGMKPSDEGFDDDHIFDDYERLILNVDREVYIQGHLIKIYNDCSHAVFQGSLEQCYASMSLLSPEGTTTTPILEESSAGISIAEMNNYVPMNYALASNLSSPFSIDPENGGVMVNMASINSDIVGGCPQSYLTFTRDSADFFGMQFDSYTDINFNNGTYYQYWDFGDGTGSFQEDPYHIYTTQGAYTISLTTFNEDCGCWDVASMELGVGFTSKSCYASFFTDKPGNPGTINFHAQGADDGGSPVVSYYWDFNDGTTITGGADVQHTYNVNNTYYPSLTTTYANGCTASYTLDPSQGLFFDNLVDPSCCDKTKNKIRNEAYDPFDNGNFELRITDVVNPPKYISWDKIKAKQVFYRKKSNGKWKRQKADYQLVAFGGHVTLLDDGECANRSKELKPNILKKEVTNKKKCKLKHTDSDDEWGLSENSLLIYHKVEHNGQTPFAKTKYFGDGC